MQGLVTCLQAPGKPPPLPLLLPPALPPSAPSLTCPPSLPLSSSVPLDLSLSAPSLFSFSLSSCFDQQRRPSQRRRWMPLGLEKHPLPSLSHRCESSPVGSGGFPLLWQGFGSHHLPEPDNSSLSALPAVCSVLSAAAYPSSDRLLVLPPVHLSSNGRDPVAAGATAPWRTDTLSVSIATTLASYATAVVDRSDNEVPAGAAAAILAVAVIWVSTREKDQEGGNPGRAGCSSELPHADEAVTVDKGGSRTGVAKRRAAVEKRVAAQSFRKCAVEAEKTTKRTQHGSRESEREAAAATVKSDVTAADEEKRKREQPAAKEVRDHQGLQQRPAEGGGASAREATSLAESIRRQAQRFTTDGAVVGAPSSAPAGDREHQDIPAKAIFGTEGVADGGGTICAPVAGKLTVVLGTGSDRLGAMKGVPRGEVTIVAAAEESDIKCSGGGIGGGGAGESEARDDGTCALRAAEDSAKNNVESGKSLSSMTLEQRERSNAVRGGKEREPGGGRLWAEGWAGEGETRGGSRRKEQLAVQSPPPPVVRVLQWNTLADGLAQTGDFVKAPLAALEWAGRAPLLLGEILRADADFICLQEVNHFHDFFAPKLKDRSDAYAGFFHPKMASPARRFGFDCDGCAMFYRCRRFRCLEERAMNYVDSSTARCLNQGLQLCVFEERSSGHRLIVANTHLKAGEEYETLRVSQAEQMLRALEQIAGRYPDAPVVICGDFNAPPESQVCARMRSHLMGLRSAYAGYIGDCAGCHVSAPASADGGPHHCSDGAPASSSACGGEDTRDADAGGGCLEFLCVCTVAGDGGDAKDEPPFTTWKFRSRGEKRATIDYIWYADECGRARSIRGEEEEGCRGSGLHHGRGMENRSRRERRSVFRPRQRWRLPDETVIGVDALPSSSFPSDHLPLMCEFAWMSTGIDDAPLRLTRVNGKGSLARQRTGERSAAEDDEGVRCYQTLTLTMLPTSGDAVPARSSLIAGSPQGTPDPRQSVDRSPCAARGLLGVSPHSRGPEVRLGKSRRGTVSHAIDSVVAPGMTPISPFAGVLGASPPGVAGVRDATAYGGVYGGPLLPSPLLPRRLDYVATIPLAPVWSHAVAPPCPAGGGSLSGDRSDAWRCPTVSRPRVVGAAAGSFAVPPQAPFVAPNFTPPFDDMDSSAAVGGMPCSGDNSIVRVCVREACWRRLYALRDAMANVGDQRGPISDVIDRLLH
ncbi:hypothetical protein CBR_g23065 [Chara braunii]|uniref:Endonuclease/exonuclease/phosphatase domain-containing protein n=1 Tax=Chara braunii TaxID=69332 RepID=A0A388L3H5_CHABU|nr:hypothetical protein CBR_g23065 [Chara braunii]|eukprot:GBG76850.1 hypothetical protein CBR_g23065 [Chara braunii]